MAARLDRILTGHRQPKAAFGGCVIELPSGRVVYEREAARPLIPASNMKLIVMAAALDALGGDYRFETILAIRGQDLVVIGGGDPTIGDERLCNLRGEPATRLFKAWAAMLKNQGLTQFRGRLVIDDSLFDTDFVHPNWPADQHETWYEAPVGGLNLCDNCVNVHVKPGAAGQPARVAVAPPSGLIQLDNRTRSGGRHSAAVRRGRSSDTIVVSGRVARACSHEISIRDPGLYFGHALRAELAAAGIHIGGVVRARVRTSAGALPADCRIIDRHLSPLTDALRRAGKNSLGMMAEALFKLLGARRSGEGTWRSGAEAVGAYLRKAGVPAAEFRIDDGSGLSRENRLSARATTSVLRHVFTSPGGHFDVLRESLAVSGGADDTLSRRLRKPQLKGRIFAKTGTIKGVRTLAGYIRTTSDRWLAFAFYYNEASKPGLVRQLQDAACELLVQHGGR
jgi:D-alanyl-D-alanine carboxypeptidase/D-alanyl-D-alanine-endopeptidase (penicillin-binding protein 4)